MIFLSEREVKQLLPMAKAIELVRDSFHALAAETGTNQPRRRMGLTSGVTMHAMAGAMGSYFGTKVYNTHPKKAAHFLFLLFRVDDGVPLAVMEANELGRIRTGAASGVATDILARPESSVVAMVGSGFQARSQLHAVSLVRKVRQVRVYSRRQASREQFVEEFREYDAGMVEAVSSAEAAVEGADILITATQSTAPVVADAAIPDGIHINAIGSNARSRRELAPETLRRAGLIALDSREQAAIEAGDLLQTWGEEPAWPGEIVTEMTQLMRGERPARQSPKEITIYKSLGLGIQDVAVGAWVYERALRTGIGTRIAGSFGGELAGAAR